MGRPAPIRPDSPEAVELRRWRSVCPDLDRMTKKQVLEVLRKRFRASTTEHQARQAHEYFRTHARDGRQIIQPGPALLNRQAAKLVARFPGVVLRLMDGTPLRGEERVILEEETGVKKWGLYRAIDAVKAYMETRPGVSTYRCILDLHLWAFGKGLQKEPLEEDDDALQKSVVKLHSAYQFTDPDLKAPTP